MGQHEEEALRKRIEALEASQRNVLSQLQNERVRNDLLTHQVRQVQARTRYIRQPLPGIMRERNLKYNWWAQQL
jgi:hypothetical protein